MKMTIKDWLQLIIMFFFVVVVLAIIIVPQFMLAHAEYEEKRLQDPNYVVVCDSCGSHIAKL